MNSLAHLVLEHKILAVAVAWALTAYWRSVLSMMIIGAVAMFLLGLLVVVGR